jgi:hypothetical protein
LFNGGKVMVGHRIQQGFVEFKICHVWQCYPG